MTRALSMDLRERAMARLEKGETCRQVAATPQVGVTSVVKWSRRKRDTGSCAPKKPPGPKPYVLKETQRDYIRKRLRDEPHDAAHDIGRACRARDEGELRRDLELRPC